MREKHGLVALAHALTWDQAHQPGMCPEWERNWRPFTLQDNAKPTEPHWSELLRSLSIALWTTAMSTHHLRNAGLDRELPLAKQPPSRLHLGPTCWDGVQNQSLGSQGGKSSAVCLRAMDRYVGQPPAGEAHGSGCPWLCPPE